MSRAVAYVPDLMDRSRVGAALPGVVFAASPADLSAPAALDADLLVVDLSRPGVVDAAAEWRRRREAGRGRAEDPAAAAVAGGGGVVDRGASRVVGFAPHVDDDLLAAARHEGIEALPRSLFFRRLPELAG